MKEALRSYIQSRGVELREEQFNYYASFFSERKTKKGEFLLREGETAKQLFFVAQGCLRMYTVDEKGKEHIIQFAPENWWIGDMESSVKATPSSYFIDALEDSNLLVMDTADQEKVMREIPHIAAMFQRLIQNRQTVTQKRIIFSMSASAEERYLDFLKTYPSFSQRIPQHMIASYLGITPESLSRIRKHVVGKK